MRGEMLVELIKVPNSDVAISRIGLGCARLSVSDSYRNSAKIIETALSVGVSHFDTAPSYGGGESEELIGAVLQGTVGTTVTTKFGLDYHPPKRGLMSRAYRNTVRPVLSYFPGLKSKLLKHVRPTRQTVTAVSQPRIHITHDDILRSAEQSLRRLRRERIDIFLLHQPDNVFIDDRLIQALLSLKSDGVVGAYGGAWDRIVSEKNALGQVTQCRSGSNATANRNTLVILHGVLRYVESANARSVTAKQRLREAIKPEGVAVIFSASSASQVESAFR